MICLKKKSLKKIINEQISEKYIRNAVCKYDNLILSFCVHELFLVSKCIWDATQIDVLNDRVVENRFFEANQHCINNCFII